MKSWLSNDRKLSVLASTCSMYSDKSNSEILIVTTFIIKENATQNQISITVLVEVADEL